MRQVRRHHRRRAAKVSEGRLGHQLVLQLDQRRHAATHRSLHKRQRGNRPRLEFSRFVLVAAHLLAPRLTQCAAFFWSCPLHTRNIHRRPARQQPVKADFALRGTCRFDELQKSMTFAGENCQKGMVNALSEPVIYTFLQALPVLVTASKRSPGTLQTLRLRRNSL